MWLRGFSCEALMLFVLHSPGEAHGRRASWCKGNWARRAENHTTVEKIPGSLGYFSVPFLSAIYNDIAQSTFPPVTTSAGIAPAFGEGGGCKAISWTG